MPQNFIESRREQVFLLPPDLRDWLPADHLAWFVIDAVADMDLGDFYAAYRVITGNLVPDHATIARFICRHEQALAELFTEVLKLCDHAGLVGPGVVSIDGTRIAGNASPEVNYEFERIAREIVAETRATDEAEDELYGEARGDELPEELRTAEGRREFFRRARREPPGEPKGSGLTDEPAAETAAEVPLEFDPARIVARTQGRE